MDALGAWREILAWLLAGWMAAGWLAAGLGAASWLAGRPRAPQDPETHPLGGKSYVPGVLTTTYLQAYKTGTRKLTSYKATRLQDYSDYKATRLQAYRDYRLLVARKLFTAWWP